MSDDQVRVACPACGRRFRVDPATVPEGGRGPQARCRGCEAAFFVRREGDTLVAVAPEAVPPPAPRRASVRKKAPGKKRAAGKKASAATTGSKTPAPRPRSGSVRTGSRGPTTGGGAMPPSGAEMTPFGIGDRVGRYEIEAILARGGMGGIYKAYDPAGNRHVALKVLSSTATDLDRLRFQREIQVQGNIQHPHIMPIFDSGMIGSARYYTMELLKDPLDLISLVDMVRSGEAQRDPKLRPLASLEGLIRRVIAPICEAIHHANVNEGVLHRDLKPGNVLLDRNGLRPFVIDFGVSALLDKKNARLAHLDRDLPVPLSGKGVHVTGTLVFMPPEQARGIADRRGDVWAIGALLHFLVTGEPPIEPAVHSSLSRQERIEQLQMLIDVAREEGNKDEVAQYRQKIEDVRGGRERSLDDVRKDVLRGRYARRPPGVPKGLDAIITKALMPDRERRYRHAQDLQEDLLAWLEGRPVRALVRRTGAAGGLLYRAGLLVMRHRLLAAAFVLVVGAGVAAFVLWPRTEEVDRQRLAQQHMEKALALQGQGRLNAARRAARDALRADPERDDAFAFLRHLDADERLQADLSRARALHGEAAGAFSAGDVETGLRRQAALEEILRTRVLPSFPAGADGDPAHAEMKALLAYAEGRQSLRVGGGPEGTRYALLPVAAPGGLIGWGGAVDLDPADAHVTPGAWVLRARRETGEVLVPFTVEPGGDGVEVTCPVDPASIDAESAYVGGGTARGPGGPKAVGPLVWDRAEVTLERYARFLAALKPEEQRERVPRVAGALGSAGRPLWDGVPGAYVTPSGSRRRPVEGISLYDAQAFARSEGKRLPTAAEWAWAASGPDGRLSAVGRMEDLLDSDLRLDRPLAGIADGESAKADRSPFGIYDMAGNVAEFTGTLGTHRGVTGWFVMGGSYLTPAVHALVNDARVVAGWMPLQGVGIRCVREP